MNNAWIIAMAAFITASAALLPKLLGHFNWRSFGGVTSFYECGFQNRAQDFAYATENYRAVALFIIAEVVVAAILLLCSLAVYSQLTELRTLAKYLSTIVLFLVAASYRLCFRKYSRS
jgi:NADH:ubiquinone oxidoreductase subunit 3 (subunit A)